MGGATAELFVVVTPGEPSKFGLCVADDLEICDQFSSSSGVSVDHDQHKGSEGINPLMKRVNHWLVFTDHGNWGARRTWGRILQAKLKGWGLGVS